MKKVSLALVDRDDFFADKFSRYILEHNNFFEAITFTDTEYLLTYVSKNKIDIIFIEESLYSENILSAVPNSLVLIAGSEDGNIGEISVIGKYKKMESVLKSITFKYAESVGDSSVVAGGEGNAFAIGFYSPMGGCGKTSLAVAVAGVLKDRGYRVAYINMEEVSSAGAFFDMSIAGTVSNIFLKIKNGQQNISFDIVNSFAEDPSGIKYIGQAESAMEYNELTGEEISTFISQIKRLSELDFVIFDFSADYTVKKIKALKLMNKIVMPICNSGVSINKLNVFANEMELHPKMNMLWEKFVPIINKATTNDISDAIKMLLREIEIRVLIPYNQALERANSVQDIKAFLGNYAMSIVEEMLKNR